MRTISADKQAVLSVPTRTEFLRVEVKDNTGTWRDLSTYALFFDPQISASWSENVDDPNATADVVLRREHEAMSLSPFMADSAFNRAFDPANAYAPLIALNREFRISVAVVPMDLPPESLGSPFEIFFHGRIDSFDVGSGDNISFSGRDLGGKLVNTFIEEERVYGLAGVAGNPVSCRIWQPGTAFALNTYVVPTEARRTVAGTPRFYKCTTPGTSNASTEPVWPTAGTVADGGAVWTLQGATSPDVGFPVEKVIQNILDDWSTGVTLYVPAAPSPAFDVTQYLQSRVNVLEAIRALALLYGGDVRYKWRAGTAQFELTLTDPDRLATSINYQFTKNDYEQVSSLKQEISGIRNVWQGVYSDSTDKDAAGRPKRKTIVRQDATSQSQYGRLFAEIAEEESSLIDTSAEMTRMLDAALADTKEPKIEQELLLALGFPWVEINDLMRFSANGRHYSVDQDLAVFSVQHEVREGVLKTTISTRGQPSGGFDRWHNVTTRETDNGDKGLLLFGSSGGFLFTATSIVGGARLEVEVSPERSVAGEEFEFHVSASAGFTPDSTTLKQTGKQRICDVVDLTPGITYYTKVVPFTHATAVIRGFPSTEISFVAGYNQPGHFDPLNGMTSFPLNGSFETWLGGSGNPPDTWGVQAGSWGTDLFRTATSVRGNYALAVGRSGIIASGLAPAVAGALYEIRAWNNDPNGGTSAAPICEISFLDSAFSGLGTVVLPLPIGTHGYLEYAASGVAPAGTCYLHVLINGNGVNASIGTFFDEITVRRLDSQEPAVIDVAAGVGFANSWVNFGGGYYSAAYWRDSSALVHLRGLVKSGTIAAKIFTLPAGYRPAANIYQIVVSNNAVGVLDIRTNGDVIAQAGSNVHFSLDGVTFRADQ